MGAVLELTRQFVQGFSAKYDRWTSPKDRLEEEAIRGWLNSLPEPKHLNWRYFVRLGCWKTPRQRRAYESNDSGLVEEATRVAYESSNEMLKLYALMALRGVSVAVAACILHFLHPDRFPIFDYHVRGALKDAGEWELDETDGSEKAWEAFLPVMRRLASNLDVSMRNLDKALFAYDKVQKGEWPPKGRGGGT